MGIDLNGDGVTANDADDSDAGPNQLQNFPLIGAAVLSGSTLTVSYQVSSSPSHSAYPLAVEFFLADADGQEGQRYLGAEFYPAAGLDSVVLTVSELTVGQRIVAAATDAQGNTSEFSASVTIGSGLLAGGGERAFPARPDTSTAVLLTTDQLRTVYDAALQHWSAAGLSAAQVAALSEVDLVLGDLPAAYLGLATNRRITMDTDAAGYGWYVDPTPDRHDDDVYEGRMDLLTAVMHEMGHLLGLADREHSHELMAESLLPETRLLPSLNEIDQLLASGHWME